jgi:hypothetical protein
VKDRERRLHCRRSKASISAHLQGTDMSFRFKKRKNWGRGQKVCIITQSHYEMLLFCIKYFTVLKCILPDSGIFTPALLWLLLIWCIFCHFNFQTLWIFEFKMHFLQIADSWILFVFINSGNLSLLSEYLIYLLLINYWYLDFCFEFLSCVNSF